MRKAKRTILIAMLICAGCVPVCSAKAILRRTKEKHPSAAELLDKYVKSQDKIKSFVLKYEDVYTVDNRLSFLPRYKRIKRDTQAGGYIGEIRSDGNRHYCCEKGWSEKNHPDRSRSKAEAISDPRTLTHLWDGERMYQYLFSNAGAERDTLFLVPKKRVGTRGKEIISTVRDHALRGVFQDTYKRVPFERIDSALKRANKILVQDNMEDIGGSKCYVIKAETKDSKYKIWIDPKHGYNIAQAKISRGGEGTEFGNDREISIFTYMRNVQFKKIDDVWVTLEADYGFYRKMVLGDFESSDHHCKRTELVLNPDHEALGSFENDFIRNGASTHLIGVPGILYVWQDGQVVDEKGCKVDYESIRPEKAKRKKAEGPKQADRIQKYKGRSGKIYTPSIKV